MAKQLFPIVKILSIFSKEILVKKLQLSNKELFNIVTFLLITILSKFLHNWNVEFPNETTFSRFIEFKDSQL